MDHKSRQERLRHGFGANRLDGLLVTHLPNIRYLCGFTGSSGVLVIDEERSVFFTDGRYTSQANAEVQGARVTISRKAALMATGEWLASRRKKKLTIGVESEHLTVADSAKLEGAFKSKIKLRPTWSMVERLRMVKDSEEIEHLRAAVILGASLFDTAVETIRPGVKEVDVAAEMEYAARRQGAEGMSFETIIASGPRSALPHGRASAAAILSGGFVVCDFGVILTGYCSDMTRTVHVGKLTPESRRMYQAVHEAQQAALDAVRPGVSVGRVDRAARKSLQISGLGRNFTHSTGHGVGLEIHEAPRIAKGQREILRPGMVITIEPGAYVPGRGGVRIEDMVVVTESGCEVLTPTGKELIAI